MDPDVIVFCVLLVMIVGAGLGTRFRASSITDRFTAGRQLSWLTLGASMAAAQISADTPLLVAGAVYADGLAGNWFWWIGAPGLLATLFFFAPLWRRSGVLTDVEILTLRYGDQGLARAYRVYRALLDGFVVNALVLASNLYAFTLLLDTLFAHRTVMGGVSLAGLVGAGFLVMTGLFVLMAGFRGLVRSNTFEFGLAVISAVILAGFAIAGLPQGLATLQSLHTAKGDSPFALLPHGDAMSLIVLFGLGWWHNAPGHTLLVQRMAASRDEREAGLTVMSYSLLHYVLRPWGWYLVGAAALWYWPHLARPENALPMAARALLPNGLFGVIAASIALSFMGCVNSRLNFGAAYLVNDVARVVAPGLSQRQARLIEGAAILALGLIAFGVTAGHLLSSIRGLYQFLIMMMAGTGFVAIARWYWSGTTLRAEIASHLSAVVVAGLTLALADLQKPSAFAMMSGVNFLVGTGVTLGVARLWPQPDTAPARAFHDRVRPGGPGWAAFRTSPAASLRPAVVRWLLANLALFSTIFLIVSLLAGKLFVAAGLFIVLLVSGLCLAWPLVRPKAN